MYYNIISDFFLGLCNSARIDLLAFMFFDNAKIRNLFLKMCKYNFVMHFLPLILIKICFWLFNVSFHSVLYMIIYPINIFSILFHLLHYLDLVNIACVHAPKTSKSGNAFDSASLAITMGIYNLVIYFTTVLIDLIFFDSFYLLAFLIKFLILTIYHSFYCFNNLWQYKKIKMFYRIDMHEKLWPYYIGYGSLATIIYLYTEHPFMLGMYNLYMALALTLPFLVEEKYPRVKDIPYPSINLTIFSYLVGCVFKLSKRILGSVN